MDRWSEECEPTVSRALATLKADPDVGAPTLRDPRVWYREAGAPRGSSEQVVERDLLLAVGAYPDA